MSVPVELQGQARTGLLVYDRALGDAKFLTTECRTDLGRERIRRLLCRSGKFPHPYERPKAQAPGGGQVQFVPIDAAVAGRWLHVAVVRNGNTSARTNRICPLPTARCAWDAGPITSLSIRSRPDRPRAERRNFTAAPAGIARQVSTAFPLRKGIPRGSGEQFSGGHAQRPCCFFAGSPSRAIRRRRTGQGRRGRKGPRGGGQ